MCPGKHAWTLSGHKYHSAHSVVGRLLCIFWFYKRTVILHVRGKLKINKNKQKQKNKKQTNNKQTNKQQQQPKEKTTIEQQQKLVSKYNLSFSFRTKLIQNRLLFHVSACRPHRLWCAMSWHPIADLFSCWGVVKHSFIHSGVPISTVYAWWHCNNPYIRSSCCSARLSRAQVTAFAGFSVRD